VLWRLEFNMENVKLRTDTKKGRSGRQHSNYEMLVTRCHRAEADDTSGAMIPVLHQLCSPCEIFVSAGHKNGVGVFKGSIRIG
jgi:hypothetical protein